MPKSIHRPEYAVVQRFVRAMRIEAGQTQTELSRSLGRPQSFISDVERGNRRLDILELRDICRHFGVDFVDAVGRLEGEISGI